MPAISCVSSPPVVLIQPDHYFHLPYMTFDQLKCYWPSCTFHQISVSLALPKVLLLISLTNKTMVQGAGTTIDSVLRAATVVKIKVNSQTKKI